jgi:rod shape determining protein RodA
MLKFDRRLISHFDWPLLLATLSLLACGLATVLSATHSQEVLVSRLLVRQGMWAGVGLAGMCLALSFDYHWLERYGYAIYGVAVVLLLLTAVIGTSAGGAQRWLSFGPVTVQPSELAKIPILVAAVCYLHRMVGDRPLPISSLAVPALLIGVPVLFVLRQPDLGTAISICGVVGLTLLVAGLPARLLVGMAVAAALTGPYLWTHLKPYQQQRVLTFLDPQRDPLGSGYHIIQSKIAIGSGMLAGKGYLQGTQNQLNFLPEQHTDFIFSVFAEEWGFAGAALVIALYVMLLLRCFVVAVRAKDAFGLLLACGLTAMIFLQVLINMAMAMGVLPVVGITLPFFSYGGSSLLANMIAIGLLMNVSMRRFTF